MWRWSKTVPAVSAVYQKSTFWTALSPPHRNSWGRSGPPASSRERAPRPALQLEPSLWESPFANWSWWLSWKPCWRAQPQMILPNIQYWLGLELRFLFWLNAKTLWIQWPYQGRSCRTSVHLVGSQKRKGREHTNHCYWGKKRWAYLLVSNVLLFSFFLFSKGPCLRCCAQQR